MLTDEQKSSITASIASNTSQVTQLTLLNSGLQAVLDADAAGFEVGQDAINAGIASGVAAALAPIQAALATATPATATASPAQPATAQ